MKDMKMFIVSSFLILIGVFTVLLIWLHFIGLSYGGNEILIAAAIGLIGAIVGGTISGALTLLGVQMTIKEKRESELLAMIPRQVMLIDEIVSILKSELTGIRFKEMKGDSSNWMNRLTIRALFEKQKLLEKAANVNLETYQIVLNLSDKYTTDHFYSLRIRLPSVSDTSIDINECINSLEMERDNLKRRISR